MQRSVRVVLALTAVQIAFGTWPVAGKLVLREIDPIALAWVRMIGASLFFAWLARNEFTKLKGHGVDALKMAIVGSLGMGINQVLFILGIKFTSATNATVLITTIPLFTFLVAVLSGNERMSKRTSMGLAIAFVGVLIVVRAHFTPTTLLGDFFIAANAAAYALYLVFGRSLMQRYGSTLVVAMGFIASTLWLTPFGVPRLPSSLSSSAALLLVYIVLVPTIGTYLLNGWALPRSKASVVALFVFLQPVVGVTLAVLMLGESPPTTALGGVLAIFAGVGLVLSREWTSRSATQLDRTSLR